MYPKLRTIHLSLGLFSLLFLLMYGVSAVQMAHSSWFRMKPAVTTRTVRMQGGLTDARAVAHELIATQELRGELTDIEPGPHGARFRLLLPGTVHEVNYDAISGAATVKTSLAPFIGVLNRLHHAAGFWHESPAMKWWAAAVGLISAALLALGATGLYMWFARRQDRVVGAVLLAVNLVFALTVLGLIRAAGP